MSEENQCEGIDIVENYCWGADEPPNIEECRCLFVTEPGSKLCGKHAFIEANKAQTVEVAKLEVPSE